MSVTDDIKARIDIVSYVQRYVPSLKKSGRNYKACCPFHNEKTPSFIVNPERGTWRCFGACAEGGDIFSFAQKVNGWDFKEALRELAQQAGVQLRVQTPQQKDEDARLERLRGMLTTAADYYHRRLQQPDAQPIRDYIVAERGLQDEAVSGFQLGYAPPGWDFMLKALRGLGYSDEETIAGGLAAQSDSGRVFDRFRNRLMIPIHDPRGRVVGFGGRALDPADPIKYINSPQTPLFDKSRLLFGLHSARRAIRDSGRAIIVEGYFDVIQAHQAGQHNVVAQMGTSMTEAQLRLLAPRLAKRIVLALDTDEAGINATRRSLEVARGLLERDYAGRLSVDMRILQVPAGKDPDDFLRESPSEWEALLESAQSVAEFVIELEAARLRPDSSLLDKQALAQSILPILLASENDLLRQENIQTLARRLRIRESELLAWAEAIAPASSPDPLVPPDLPPDYLGLDYAAPPPDAAPPEPDKRARHSSLRAAEGHCLSLLLRNPHLLAQVNRKLRELAGDDPSLQSGPLRELGADDFSSSRYRALMTHLQESLQQDDLEHLDFLAQEIAPELHDDLAALLREDHVALSQSLRGNFHVDLSDILKNRRPAQQPNRDLLNELISRALQLRQERLTNERVDVQYMQEEAQTEAGMDRQLDDRLAIQVKLSALAKARIDMAVG
ncbi:MAG: DNA primase [Chloroflexi bacterium]|nr:DNA primase [Chloroflexota bacterium]MCY4248686.1 DNA primase [Chloroflexota bacterium]